MSNYIKVTLKGGRPVVVLASNEAFYKAQGAKIEKPAENEITAAFPEMQRVKQPLPDGGSERAVADLKAAGEALEAEKAAHGETRKALEVSTAELKAAGEALEAAKKEMEKLTKKQ